MRGKRKRECSLRMFFSFIFLLRFCTRKILYTHIGFFLGSPRALGVELVTTARPPTIWTKRSSWCIIYQSLSRSVIHLQMKYH